MKRDLMNLLLGVLLVLVLGALFVVIEYVSPPPLDECERRGIGYGNFDYSRTCDADRR